MTPAFLYAAALALWAAYLGIWARSWGVRLSALALFALALLTAPVVENFTLSHPKPTEWELLLHAEEAEVLGFQLVEGKGIYLLLALPGIPEPRYYVMPWDMKQAEALQRAKEGTEGEGNPMMRLPFERGYDEEEPMFYALPQPKLPDKPAPSEGETFEHPEA